MLEQDQISACTLTDLPSGRDLVGAFAEGSQPLFGPNDEIGFSGSGEFAANAEVVVKRMGYRFNNSARRKLRVSVSSHSTGDKIYYSETSIFRPRMFGPRPGDLVMDEVELKARVELVDESGRVAWSTEYSTSMPHSIQGGQSGDLASRISQEHQKDCAGQLSRVFLPRHIVQVNAKPVALPGTSSLADELHGPADTP
jgi:hypothetical protein